MSVSAIVKDGKIQETASAKSMEKKESKNSVRKDDFLQLLVAEMKYQDPLEPASNTEWVSQYATFSELEQMQNMAGSLELSRASALVGQTVQIKSTDSSGNTDYVQGNVDYVTYEDGKAYLSINGELYSMDDLLNVVDPEYLEAGIIVAEFLTEFGKLPDLDRLSILDKDTVAKVKEMFEAMNDYQKSFMPDDTKDAVKSYVDRMEEIVKIAEELQKEENEETEDKKNKENKDSEETK